MRHSFFNSKSSGNHTLLLVSFMALVIAVSFAMFTTYSNYVVYAIYLLWIPTLMSQSRCLSKNEKSFVVVSLVFMTLMLLYWLIGVSSMEMGLALREFNWIMAGVVSIYAMNLFSKTELSTVYSFFVVVAVILLLVFIRMGRVLLVVEEQEEAALVTSAWYGSLFMLLSGLSLIVFIHVKSWFPKIFALLVFLLTFYLNFFVLQRGINVIFTLAEIGIILTFTLKKKGIVYSLSITIFILAIHVFNSGILTDFFDWLAINTHSERLARRFSEISLALAFEDLDASVGSLSGRNELLGNSWKTFTSSVGHFFFGAGEHSQDNTIIGHHSFFLDTLARYGVLGGLLAFIYFKKQYQIIMSELDKRSEWVLYMQCSTVFLFYILRNYYGILAYALVNLFVLVLFPLTFQLIHHYKNKIHTLV